MEKQQRSKPKRIWLRRGLRIVAGVFLLALLNGFYHTHKSLPDGVSFAGPEREAQDVQFLRDLTFLDADGTRQVEQEIFDAVFSMIRSAEQFILIDMFLFNDFQGAKPEDTRALCGELTDALVARRDAMPDIEIHLITDPINTVYGGMEPDHLQRLEEAGVRVTLTDLTELRDSNAIYSSFWRLFVKPFGNSAGELVRNPFGEGRVSLRSYFALLNFKANHRKTIAADSPDGLVGLVTSANPHNGSSAHENVALQFGGAAVVDLIRAEQAVIRFSGGSPIQFDFETFANDGMDSIDAPATDNVTLKVVSENEIEAEALRLIDSADQIDLVMFYLSDREVVTALKRAAQRGARLRVILDPNKDAFGHQKGGVPNRQVAEELMAVGNVELRWADTHGEQCHSKLLLTRHGDGESALLLGSANYTRRNLDDLNLELNVAVVGPGEQPVFTRATDYFELAWNNQGGRIFTTEFETYRDDSILKKLRYRLMERTGLSTF